MRHFPVFLAVAAFAGGVYASAAALAADNNAAPRVIVGSGVITTTTLSNLNDSTAPAAPPIMAPGRIAAPHNLTQSSSTPVNASIYDKREDANAPHNDTQSSDIPINSTSKP